MFSGHAESFSRGYRGCGQNLTRGYHIYGTRKSRVSVPQRGNGCYVHKRAGQSAGRSGKMARRIEPRRMKTSGVEESTPRMAVRHRVHCSDTERDVKWGSGVHEGWMQTYVM